MPSTAHQQHVYRPDIDGMRALAVAGVVIFHAFPKTIPGGFVGVDVFFVISGYLITSIILREMAEGRFSFLAFYARRARRIFPALIVTCLITAGLGWFLLVAEEYRDLGAEMGFGAAFLANFNYYASTGYFDRGDDTKYLLHLWSLAVEEQYYLVWPLMLLVLHKFKAISLMSLTIIGVISFVANIYFTSVDMSFAFYMPFTRFWELMTGSLLASLSQSGRTLTDGRNDHVGTLVSAIGLGLILYAFFAFDRTVEFPGWRAALPVAGAAMIIGIPTSNPVNRLLSSRLLVGLGLISYPIYLLHWPLLNFAKTVAILKPSTSIRLAIIALSVLGAVAIYRCVETPVRQSWNLARIAVVASLLLVGVCLAGTATVVLQGFPQRWAATFGPDVAAYRLSQQLATNIGKGCGDLPKLENAECRSTVPLDLVDVVIIGDSHAGAVFPALHDELSRLRKHVAWFGGSACPFLLDIERDHKCGTDPEAILDVLRATPSVKTVVLISRWPLYATNQRFGPAEEGEKFFEITAPSDPGRKDPSAILLSGLDRTVATLIKAGKNVVFFLDVPELGFDPSRCVARPLRTTPMPCQLERRDFVSRTVPVRKIADKLKASYPQLMIYDPSAQLCDETTCEGRRGGVFLYHDDDHLSSYGAGLVAAAAAEALNQVWERPQ